MKVLTVLGTRPELIRLSCVIERLDRLCDHVVVHTGQNYERTLSDIFFADLGIRQPDRYLNIRGTGFGERVGRILASCEAVFEEERPDRLLVLGDTDSALAAFAAKRHGIPVFHMEAGNRCFDDRVPEEVNRRVIDHCSDVLMPYSERSRSHLLREGVRTDRILVTGNPIYEVLCRHESAIEQAEVLQRLGLTRRGYFLLTAHRQENVDVEMRLRALVTAVGDVARTYGQPVICSLHPRMKSRLDAFGIELGGGEVRTFEPFGWFDFVKLEREARCVLTDSGTVQEECCILGTPAVTLRDVTERPETVECGSNTLSGVQPDAVLRAVRVALDRRDGWPVPPEYRVPLVSATVASIVLGHLQ